MFYAYSLFQLQSAADNKLVTLIAKCSWSQTCHFNDEELELMVKDLTSQIKYTIKNMFALLKSRDLIVVWQEKDLEWVTFARGDICAKNICAK